MTSLSLSYKNAVKEAGSINAGMLSRFSSMKTPRDLRGETLVKLLSKHFGYELTRQQGSHIRLTTAQNGTHHLTVPNHNPVRLGTLKKILSDVANHFGMSQQEVDERLFS